MNTSAIIVAAIVAPLPIFGSDPKVAGFITRYSNRLWIIGVACVFGMIGMTASTIHLVPTKVGLYFWSPLWQVLVVQTLYFVWYRYYKRPPVSVAFNWHRDLTADRFLAIGIGLLGTLVPLFIIGR
jgi:hypothetical protein